MACSQVVYPVIFVLLARLLRILRPGGRLLISDYCCAPTAPSTAFAAYIAQRGYDLHDVAGYGKLLQNAGFVDVRAEDRTWQVREWCCQCNIEFHNRHIRHVRQFVCCPLLTGNLVLI